MAETKAMTIQELRVFLDSWFCGCGSPRLAAERLRDILKMCPLYNNREEFEKLVPDEGIQYLVLYTLDRFELLEHGTSIRGAWLTDKGESILVALEREATTDFIALDEECCAHGEVTGEDCKQCESTIEEFMNRIKE